MAIASTIKEGATAVAATGGTDMTLVSLGIQGNKNTLYSSTDTSLATRRLFEFSAKPTAPNVNSPGGYTLARETVKITFPLVLANDGGTSLDYIEITVATHPECTQAALETRLEIAAQCLATTNFLDFYKNQNLN
jgi:hypothetical protein